MVRYIGSPYDQIGATTPKPNAWSGRPWDVKNDGLAITSSTYTYNQTGTTAWGSLPNGGVIVGLTGTGSGNPAEYYLQFPNAGQIKIGNHIGATTAEFVKGQNLSNMWLPPGTGIGNQQYADDVVVHQVDGSYEDCLKLFPGLIDMSLYDEATNLKGFNVGVGGYVPYDYQNPNGCTVFYFSGAPDQEGAANGYGPNFHLQIRDSVPADITNGKLVGPQSDYTHYNANLEISHNYRVPFPLKLAPSEQIYCAMGGYIIAYDPLGWV